MACVSIMKDAIMEETPERKKGLKKDWIVKSSNDKHWFIGKKDASKMCSKLGVQCDVEECHCDCCIWLPDVRWGKEAMLFCPNCQSNSRVGPYGFGSNHHARHTRGAKESCFILSRRCVCLDYGKECNAHGNELMSKVSEIGLSVKEANDDELEEKS